MTKPACAAAHGFYVCLTGPSCLPTACAAAHEVWPVVVDVVDLPTTCPVGDVPKYLTPKVCPSVTDFLLGVTDFLPDISGSPQRHKLLLVDLPSSHLRGGSRWLLSHRRLRCPSSHLRGGSQIVPSFVRHFDPSSHLRGGSRAIDASYKNVAPSSHLRGGSPFQNQKFLCKIGYLYTNWLIKECLRFCCYKPAIFSHTNWSGFTAHLLKETGLLQYFVGFRAGGSSCLYVPRDGLGRRCG